MADDDDDSYSFDDDFTSTSQDERFGLSSICEEPADPKSTSKNNGILDSTKNIEPTFNAIINNHLERKSEERKEYPKSEGKESQAGKSFCEIDSQVQNLSKKPARLPRCATLTTKSMSRTHELESQTSSSEQKKCRYSKKRLHELSQPRKHHIYGLSSNIEKVHNKSTNLKKIIRNTSFLNRMECMEQERREKRERQAAEAAYNAKADVDKLHCSKCGRTQTYSEWSAKSMICQNDECSKKKIVYGKTQLKTKDFLERLERSNQRKSIKINEILIERRTSLISQCLEKSQLQKELIHKVSKNGQNFMARMEKDIHARHRKASRQIELIDEALSKKHPFKPKLTIPDHLIQNRKGGLSSLAAPAPRYTQTFDERLEECKKKQGMMTRPKSKKREPIESLWQEKTFTGRRGNRK